MEAVKTFNLIGIALASLLLVGCGSASDSTPNEEIQKEADKNKVDDEKKVTEPAREFVEVPAGPFTVLAGEERFLCYTSTLKEDVVVDRFEFESTPAIHHLFMSKSMVKVEDGVEECDVLFRSTWSPLYIAGTGNAPLEAPDGAGYKLKAGAQIVIQLHLLNATTEDVTEELVIKMRKSLLKDVEPIGIMAFGTLGLALPPNAVSSAVGACNTQKKLNVFAAFPHMHYMGESMVVEFGPNKDELKEIFRRDPYDFDDQSMEPFVLDMAKGDHLKVTCNYNNTSDKVITFGESTTNEMCFFIAFVAGLDEDLGTCFGGGSFFPPECGTDPANDIGLGAKCTKGGGECNEGLQCTDDLYEALAVGLCISVNKCKTSADCGTDGVCCGLDVSSFKLDLCVPPSCLLPGCEPK